MEGNPYKGSVFLILIYIGVNIILIPQLIVTVAIGVAYTDISGNMWLGILYGSIICMIGNLFGIIACQLISQYFFRS